MPTEPMDAYELLGVSQDARDEEINKAFRQRSLKVHPDRNPDNPDAATKFHELKVAQELLTDPLRRAELDASLRKQRAHKEKYARFDAKRKVMQDDLEEREREFKRAKTGIVKAQREREEEAHIRDQGRRMREEKEQAALAKNQQHIPDSKPPVMDSGGIDSTDLTVRIKFTTTLRPDISTPEALIALLRPFGVLDENSVLLSIKPPKKHPSKPPRFATALVTFQKVQGAFGAVSSSGQKVRGLENMDIAWAKGVEPEVVQRLRIQGKLVHSLDSDSVRQRDRAAASGCVPKDDQSYSSAAPEAPLDATAFEALEMEALLQLRQAEKARLERQKREHEPQTNSP